MNPSKQYNTSIIFSVFLLLSTNLILAQNSNDLEGWSAIQVDVRASEKMSF